MWALAGKAAEGGWRGPLALLGIGIAICVVIEVLARKRGGK